MKRFPTAEELVASYWRKLARSIERQRPWITDGDLAKAIRKRRAASPLGRRNSERLPRRVHARVAA